MSLDDYTFALSEVKRLKADCQAKDARIKALERYK